MQLYFRLHFPLNGGGGHYSVAAWHCWIFLKFFFRTNYDRWWCRSQIKKHKKVMMPRTMHNTRFMQKCFDVANETWHTTFVHVHIHNNGTWIFFFFKLTSLISLADFYVCNTFKQFPKSPNNYLLNINLKVWAKSGTILTKHSSIMSIFIGPWENK